MLTRCCALMIAALAAFGAPYAPAQTPFQPVATVNDDVITAFDIDQRMRILAASGAPVGDTQQLRNLALDQLIADRLRLQAGERNGLEPSDEIVAAGLAELAEESGVTPERFRSGLAEQGVGAQALDDMVAAQVIWREVVRGRFLQQVEPGEADIDAEIALAGEGGTVEVRLSEIAMPMSYRGSESATRQFAQDLSIALQAGGDFSAAVAEHSRSDSRAQGGDLGWVGIDNLPPVLQAQFVDAPIGTVSDPLEVRGGIAILGLTDRRIEQLGETLDPEDPELRERVRRRLTTERLERFAQGLLQELRRDALIEIRQ